MCAIAGIWSEEPVSREALAVFTRSMANRGPDGEGYRLEDDGRIGLGHRRLAILDPTPAGRQPMALLGGRYWLTFNGEIYNFIELRRELEAAGYRFQTDTDAEVILAAYAEWGEECQLRFNGMWAFGIWDRAQGSLFLSRDRFGVKPLYYAHVGSRFSFASEIKAFLFLRDFSARVRSELVLSGGRPAAHETHLENVLTLLPGHSLRLSAPGGDLRIQQWWRPYEHLQTVPPKYREQVEVFRDLFTDACRLRLRSDVPIATSISGGLDSSSVLCTLSFLGRRFTGSELARRPRDWQTAFFADAPDSWHSDADRPFAHLAIRETGSKPRVMNFWEEPVSADIEDYLFQTEGDGGFRNVWSWALYRRMRRDGVSVTIDGHGADEILGGYTRGIAAELYGGDGFRRPLRALSLMGTLNGLEQSPLRRLYNYPGLLATWILCSMPFADRIPAVGKLRSALDGTKLIPSPARPEERAALGRLGPLGAALYASVYYRELPRNNWFFDIYSMSHGVEVRMPFLDYRLVCFALSLPDESRVGGGFTKRILRDAMTGRVPDAIRRRRDKIGYARPIDDLFEGPLRSWVREQVNQPSFLTHRSWKGAAIRDSIERGTRPNWHRVASAVRKHWIVESWLTAARSRTVSSLTDESCLVAG
jgi:asparagine synthase (glutamine-hydrolysing)